MMALEVDADADRMAEVAALLVKHRVPLLAYLIAAVRDGNDAEDLLQEVSMAAVRSWEQFTPGTNFLAWAREIARRRVLEYAKASRKAAALLDPEVLAALEAAAREADDPPDRRRDALRECLAGMGGHARRVLDLRYAEGLSVDRIAHAIGKTVQSAYALLKRARAALRDCAARRLEATP
jgi:RNA polymerase sigma-70 factor (ECF subfamily)